MPKSLHDFYWQRVLQTASLARGNESSTSKSEEKYDPNGVLDRIAQELTSSFGWSPCRHVFHGSPGGQGFSQRNGLTPKYQGILAEHLGIQCLGFVAKEGVALSWFARVVAKEHKNHLCIVLAAGDRRGRVALMTHWKPIVVGVSNWIRSGILHPDLKRALSIWDDYGVPKKAKEFKRGLRSQLEARAWAIERARLLRKETILSDEDYFRLFLLRPRGSHKETLELLREALIQRLKAQDAAASGEDRDMARFAAIRIENEVVERNLQLAGWCASQFKAPVGCLERVDHLQEAAVGLLAAVRRFDVTRGTQFSTYAVHWARERLLRSLHDRSTFIRVPAYKYGSLVGRQLRQTLSRIQSIDSLTRNDIYRLSERQLETAQIDLRLDALTVLSRGISALRQRERQVLCWRFGFDGHDRLTLDQIAAHLGVSRERVRQIERRALDRLRITIRIPGVGVPEI